jgi:hypothetical protein
VVTADDLNLVSFANGLANSENNPGGPNVLFGLGGFAVGIDDHSLSTYGAKLGESLSPNTSMTAGMRSIRPLSTIAGMHSNLRHPLMAYLPSNQTAWRLTTVNLTRWNAQSPISYLQDSQQYSQLASSNNFADSLQQSLSLIEATNQSIESSSFGASNAGFPGVAAGGFGSPTPIDNGGGFSFSNDFGGGFDGDFGDGPVVLDLSGQGH